MRYLKYRQKLPLNLKIKYTEARILDWINYWGKDNVYVSFSGGKDSTVLLDICRQIYPEIEAVFVDTGLEYPEIRDFVSTINNVTWLHPKRKGKPYSFKKVIEDYGYPIISKEQSCYIDQFRNTKNEKLREKRMFGKVGKISEKWKYLIDAPFKISDRCCYFIKKQPIKAFEKKTGKKAIVGTMAEESNMRRVYYEKYGCNTFGSKRPISKPLSFWREEDILTYIKDKKLKYSKIYDMGYKRTGCMFCLFGYHMELKSGHDRLELLKKTHPNQYKYIMDKLKFDEVLKWYPKRKT